MKISVIVPAFNEEKLIGESLKATQEAMTVFVETGWQTELIVTDNNSTDRTAEIALGAGATVVFEPINQISRARNRGAEAATGDWMVFVDADSKPSRELFLNLISVIQGGRSIGGGCAVHGEGSSYRNGYWWFAQLWNGISRMKRWAAGSFIYCETSAFMELGGFSTELFAAEEIDFSERLKKLASRKDKKVVILQGTPLVTSVRKMRLYTLSDHLRLVWNGLLRPKATLRSREACSLWYDGRR